MMAAARTPTDTAADRELEQEIADLWADGFDTFDIAVGLASTGHLNERGQPITEADVYRLLWRPQVRSTLPNSAKPHAARVPAVTEPPIEMEADDARGA